MLGEREARWLRVNELSVCVSSAEYWNRSLNARAVLIGLSLSFVFLDRVPGPGPCSTRLSHRTHITYEYK